MRSKQQLSGREIMDHAMSERQLSDSVKKAAKDAGWKVLETRDSRRSPEGEFDLRMIRPPRYICAELKKEAGKLSAAQQEVYELLKGCPGIEAYVWRPRDLDEVYQLLLRIS